MGSKWWFTAGGQAGTRTLEQQLTGLERLWPEVGGRTVFDLGAAEGAIAAECKRRGATAVEGIELRADAAARARSEFGVEIHHGDANTYNPRRDYDVVLMLAILHKLRDPSTVFARMLSCSRHLAVVRLRHCDWPVLRDARSGNLPHNLGAIAKAAGFALEHVADGPVDSGNPPEWCGYLQRAAR